MESFGNKSLGLNNLNSLIDKRREIIEQQKIEIKELKEKIDLATASIEKYRSHAGLDEETRDKIINGFEIVIKNCESLVSEIADSITELEKDVNHLLGLILEKSDSDSKPN